MIARSFLTLLLLAALPAAAKEPARVADARHRRLTELRGLVEKAGLHYPPAAMYLRVFKEEREVEVWAADAKKPMVLVMTVPICAASGELGPKRAEGDLQVPEGFYDLVQFNATSDYHLSLKVNYPNASDRVRSDPKHPGSLIYMHGKCASIGCIAIRDEPIELVYLLALDVTQRQLPIHIFPFRMTPEQMQAHATSAHLAFWKELQPGFAAFENNHVPPSARVNAKSGAYEVR